MGPAGMSAHRWQQEAGGAQRRVVDSHRVRPEGATRPYKESAMPVWHAKVRRPQAMTQRSRPDSFAVYMATSAAPISFCGVVALLLGNLDPPTLTVIGMR